MPPSARNRLQVFDRATQFERKREAVIIAAAEAFHENGYAGTTLDYIAAQLGVTKKALYHYVSGKQEILFEIFELWLNLQELAIVAAESSEGAAEDKIRVYAHAYLTSIFDQLVPTERIVGALYALDDSDIQHIQNRRRRNDARLSKLFQGKTAKNLSNWDPKYAVHVLNGAIDWMFKWYKPGGAEKPEQAVDKVMDILMQGYVKR